MCSVPRRTWTMTDGAPSAGECGAERSHALPLVADAPEPLLCRGLAEVGAVGSPDLAPLVAWFRAELAALMARDASAAMDPASPVSSRSILSLAG